MLINVISVFVRGLVSRCTAYSYIHSGIAHPASHSTFISRMNDQGLAVIKSYNSAVLPHRRIPFNGDLLNPTARIYIGGIFTIHPVSIILTILYYTIYIFSSLHIGFGPLEHYSQLKNDISYLFWTYSRRMLISLQIVPYHVYSLPQHKFSGQICFNSCTLY